MTCSPYVCKKKNIEFFNQSDYFCRKQKQRLQIKQTRPLKLVTSLSDSVMNPESTNFEEVWGLYSYLCNENVNKNNHFVRKNW